MSGYKWSNSDSTPKQTSELNSTANLCRVVVDPDIKKTIQLDELSMPIDKSNDGAFSDTQYNSINRAGIDAPMICINDTFLEKEEIVYLEIDWTSFIPSITLSFKPKNINFLNKSNPIISSIILNSNTRLV